VENNILTELTLKRIDNLIGLPAKETPEFQAVPQILGVLCVPAKRAQQARRELLSLRRFGYDVKIIAPNDRFPRESPEISAPRHAEDYGESVFSENVTVLVAVLDQGTAAKAALGLQDNAALEVILHCLWRGIKTFVDLTEVRLPYGQISRNEKLEQIYGTYSDVLRNLGAIEIEQKHYASTILAYEKEKAQNLFLDKAQDRPIPLSSKKRAILTERDVQSLKGMATELILPQNAIITSLAREAAEKLHIALKLKKDLE